MEQPEQAPEPMGITPYLTAILLCDQVIQDATTKKVTLVGVFDRAYVPAFPGGVAATLFARLTDAEGVYQFRIEHVYIPTNRVLGTADVPAQTITDRLQHVQLVLAMGLQVDEPGPYEIRLSANEAYLGRAPLEVLAAPANGGLPMAIEIREPGLQLSVVEPTQASSTVATAAPASPGRQAGGLPSDFLVGTLHHPLLRLRHPVRLAVAQDGEFVTVTLDEVDEFGYGPHLTAAVEDWQQTIAELYLTLRAEHDRLGPAMADLWEQLQTVVEARP